MAVLNLILKSRSRNKKERKYDWKNANLAIFTLPTSTRLIIRYKNKVNTRFRTRYGVNAAYNQVSFPRNADCKLFFWHVKKTKNWVIQQTGHKIWFLEFFHFLIPNVPAYKCMTQFEMLLWKTVFNVVILYASYK